MTQIPYALQFVGKVVPANAAGTVLSATLSAPPCLISTSADPGEFRGVIRTIDGPLSTFKSTVTFHDETTFNEVGIITLGASADSIRFSTVGRGYLGGSVDPKVKHGSVAWKIDSGTGRFAGATGLITSNFLVTAAGDVTDHHFGIIFLK